VQVIFQARLGDYKPPSKHKMHFGDGLAEKRATCCKPSAQKLGDKKVFRIKPLRTLKSNKIFKKLKT
jgi:hypothetical protein